MASHVTFDDGPLGHAEEPTIDELLNEPIIQLVMQRDGVKLQDMRHQLDRMLATCSA